MSTYIACPLKDLSSFNAPINEPFLAPNTVKQSGWMTRFSAISTDWNRRHRWSNIRTKEELQRNGRCNLTTLVTDDELPQSIAVDREVRAERVKTVAMARVWVAIQIGLERPLVSRTNAIPRGQFSVTCPIRWNHLPKLHQVNGNSIQGVTHQ